MFSKEEIALMRESAVNRGVSILTEGVSFLSESSFVDNEVKKANFRQMNTQEFRTGIAENNDKLKAIVADGKLNANQAKEVNEFIKNTELLSKLYDDSYKNSKRSRNLVTLGLTGLVVVVGSIVYAYQNAGEEQASKLMDILSKEVAPFNNLIRGKIDEVGESITKSSEFKEVQKISSEITNTKEFQRAKGVVDKFGEDVRKGPLGGIGGLFESVGFESLLESTYDVDRVNAKRTTMKDTGATTTVVTTGLFAVGAAWRKIFGANAFNSAILISSTLLGIFLFIRLVSVYIAVNKALYNGKLKGLVSSVKGDPDAERLIRVFEDDKKEEVKRKAERSRWLKGIAAKLRMAKKDQESLI